MRNQIYAEYFDSRKYFLDIYLDAISNAYVSQVGINEFLAAFIGKYIDVVNKEKAYFEGCFPETDKPKFQMFLSDFEFVMLSSRIRNWVSRCIHYQEMGLAIDVIKSLENQLSQSSHRIGAILQERMMFLASEKLKGVFMSGKKLI